MKKLCIMLAIASFALMNYQIASFAEGSNTKPECNGGQCQEHWKKHHHHHGEFFKKLNLTKEQQARVKANREKSMTEMKPLFKQLKAEKHKYREMKESKASPEALSQQKAKIHQLRDQMKAIHKRNFENFEKILTPEQKAKFEEQKKQRKQEMKEKFKERKGHEYGNEDKE